MQAGWQAGPIGGGGAGRANGEPPSPTRESTSTSAYERAFFQTRVMRLTNPNDELGGMLFLATPQVSAAALPYASNALSPY